ncbi:hypothetical protein LZ30DRAFT_605967 [Colletotrichum cereale]|nr:hypothetical protein LZ30DRAFT_605967 [Colletotrichum cereale]
MVYALFQAPAAAYATRASSLIVKLGHTVEPWLTQVLRGVNGNTRPLESVLQHQRCLIKILSAPQSIWTLACIMVSRSPESELRQGSNQLVEASYDFQIIHIEAYIICVDMVLQNEVVFKLTTESIDAIVEYHQKVHCVDNRTKTYEWPEKEQQSKKLHQNFVQAINNFEYRTNVSALEGLENDGAGELLGNESEEVKEIIMGLMKPLPPL